MRFTSIHRHTHTQIDVTTCIDVVTSTHRRHVHPYTNRCVFIHACIGIPAGWTYTYMHEHVRSFLCVSTLDIFNPHRNWIARFPPPFSDVQEPNSGHVRKPSHSSSTADDSWMVADKETGMRMHTHMRGMCTHAMYILVHIYIWRVHMCIYIYICQFLAHVYVHTCKKQICTWTYGMCGHMAYGICVFVHMHGGVNKHWCVFMKKR